MSEDKEKNYKRLKKKREKFNSLPFNKELIKKDGESLRNLLSDYISNAIGRIDRYEEQRKWFLEINLAFLAFLGTAFVFILSYLLNPENIPINISILILLVGISIGIFIFIIFSLIIIFYYFIEHGTEFEDEKDFNKTEQELNKFWISPRFHRGITPKKEEIECDPLLFIKKLNKFAKNFTKKDSIEKLLREDIKTLFNIYIHQDNYYRIGTSIRELTKWSFIILIIFIIGSPIVSLITFIIQMTI